MSYMRVVRFTGVDPERMSAMLSRINEAESPPPGVNATGIKVLVDEAQGTAVVLQNYATAEDMEAAAAVFDAMDSADTPGTRASVDACEQKLEKFAG